MAFSTRRVVIAILLAALAIRVAWVFATPDYRLVHDALDYNRHAISIARGDGFALSYGRETAFRPPAYPIFLAAVYWIFGPSLEWARLANALVGTGIVALIGVISWQVWDRRVALIAMALGAVYIPLILVGQSVMSEPLFVLCMLGAIACALRGWAIGAGVLIGLAVLGRANALILLFPLAWAVCRQGRPRGGLMPRAGKGPKPALIMVVAAALTVLPWTIRNYVVLDHFVPVSTQLGSALAGTYNSEAMNNKENPAAWMSLKRVDDYRPIFNQVRETNEAVLEKELRSASLEYIKDHPGAPLKVAYWTTRRMLDLGGWDWAIHTAGTVSAGKRAGAAGIVCFWAFAILAVIGAFTRRAREAPLWLWAVPVLMYLGVVFLVVETPRYRLAIDPFVIMLAALALNALARGGRAGAGSPSRLSPRSTR